MDRSDMMSFTCSFTLLCLECVCVHAIGLNRTNNNKLAMRTTQCPLSACKWTLKEATHHATNTEEVYITQCLPPYLMYVQACSRACAGRTLNGTTRVWSDNMPGAVIGFNQPNPSPTATKSLGFNTSVSPFKNLLVAHTYITRDLLTQCCSCCSVLTRTQHCMYIHTTTSNHSIRAPWRFCCCMFKSMVWYSSQQEHL